MTELQKKYVIYLLDIDPDTGDVSQMKPIAYVESEHYANIISQYLKSVDNGGDGNRTYKFTQL